VKGLSREKSPSKIFQDIENTLIITAHLLHVSQERRTLPGSIFDRTAGVWMIWLPDMTLSMLARV